MVANRQQPIQTQSILQEPILKAKFSMPRAAKDARVDAGSGGDPKRSL